jgi:hypothetical protein
MMSRIQQTLNKGGLKMITIMTQDHTTSRYKNYDELFSYVLGQVHKKLEDGKNKVPWGFSIYIPRKYTTRTSSFLPFRRDAMPVIIREAQERQLWLLEIITGCLETPVYHLMTPGLNMADLRKRWALDYCAAHGITVS